MRTIFNWFEWLTRRRARALRHLAVATGASAAPLTMTEVRHGEFSLVLPGAWREQRRTLNGCELVSSVGPERVTVTARKLVVPVPDNDLSALAERVLAEHRVGMMDQPSAVAWSAPEIGTRDGTALARCKGHLESQQMHVALLVWATPAKVLAATLSSPGAASGAAAFCNLATVIFDRLVA